MQKYLGYVKQEDAYVYSGIALVPVTTHVDGLRSGISPRNDDQIEKN